MATNIFSRFAPARGTRSFYEGLRARDEDYDADPELGHNVDEENLREQFHDYDVDQTDALGVADSRVTLDSTTLPAKGAGPSHPRGQAATQKPKGATSRWLSHDDDVDNDVPASLLVEPQDVDPSASAGQRLAAAASGASKHPAIPGPSTGRSRTQWDVAQAQQRLHHEDTFSSGKSQPGPLATGRVFGSDYDKALWRWANVSNVDGFMRDVYEFYLGKGWWCIICDRALHIVQSIFVAVFMTFLTQCVDYSKIPSSTSLRQVTVPQCTRHMSALWNFVLFLVVFYLIWKIWQFLFDLSRLARLRSFYTYLLGIPEEDMQTVSWQDVVSRIMRLREVNPKTARSKPVTAYHRKWIRTQSKERLDAHDIANRLMRRDNYLIAMINKDILNLTVSFPLLRGRQLYSWTLEWYLRLAVIEFVFNGMGQVNPEFLKSNSRGILSQKLKQRLYFYGFIHILTTPFLVAYLVIVYFFTYYQEYQKDPSTLGARRYTPFAEWKFREFNELPHLFYERLNMSYPFATRYNDQFPKMVTEQLARAVAFMAGALVAVLAVASILDPELFLNFEITPSRTALFYIGIFGTVWAAARGSISEDTLVFDPEYALRNVIEYTRFCPENWQGRLHSSDVKREFSQLYKPKVVIFLEELLGIITCPLLLLFSLPSCTDCIVDFFREFTVHVDGLGYVCSFAVFDFEKGVGAAKKPRGTTGDRDDYYSTKHGKMAASYYGFLDNYVINPKTGIPGHLPPGTRQQFHPPPAFPGLNSPTMAAEMYGSRLGRSDRARNRAAAGPGQSTRTPRFGPVPQPSPMASMLLDPHQQPTVTSFGARSGHPPRGQRGGGYHGEGGIIEETLEDEGAKPPDEEDVYESDALGESTWETSPAKTLSRENSTAAAGDVRDDGVMTMIYQLQQVRRNPRAGGVV